MGLIRVSDHAEQTIKRVSDGRTITATVDAILAASITPDGKIYAAKEDSLQSYLDEKFKHLESLIEDTAVDRLDRAKPSRLLPSEITWENCIQDVYFDFPDDDPVWLPRVKEAWGESDTLDQAEFASDGNFIYDVTGGDRMAVLNITPALRSYLKEKGFEV